MISFTTLELNFKVSETYLIHIFQQNFKSRELTIIRKKKKKKKKKNEKFIL
jgi:hypothetical protein